MATQEEKSRLAADRFRAPRPDGVSAAMRRVAIEAHLHRQSPKASRALPELSCVADFGR
jgi:hypothetical protein